MKGILKIFLILIFISLFSSCKKQEQEELKWYEYEDQRDPPLARAFRSWLFIMVDTSGTLAPAITLTKPIQQPMQTFFKIFILIVSLFIPLFLIFACIMLQWFIFGEGSGATEAAEKYNNVFISAYVALAVVHGWLLYKLFRNDAVWLRVASLVIVGTAYVLTPYYLNAIW